MTAPPPQDAPSLRQVAKRAGVSIMTVSNVVNGHSARVSEEVRVRVQEVIDELGYRPQRRGRSLRLQREFAIAFVIVHPDRRFLDDPYITQVAAGMSNALAQLGYALVVNGVQSVTDLASAVGHVTHFDGLAVMASGERRERVRVYEQLAHLRHPVAIVQDTVPDTLQDSCAILQDDTGGARLLAHVLLERGIKSPLVVVPRRVWPGVERRLAGIHAAFQEGVTPEVISCDETDFERTIDTIGARLSAGARPDVVMGANDQIGIAAIQAAARHGLRVPTDLAVTGFNAFWFRALAVPTLLSVVSPAYDIGEEVARELVHRVESGRFRRREIILPVELVPGGSVPLRPEARSRRRQPLRPK